MALGWRPGRLGRADAVNSALHALHAAVAVLLLFSTAPPFPPPCVRCAGLMCVWRAFYAIYLDLSSFRGVAAARRDRGKDMQHFADSLKSAMLLSLAFCAVLQVRGGGVGLAHPSPGCVAWGGCGTAGAAGRMCANTALALGGATSRTTHTLLALPLLPTSPMRFLQCLGGLVGEEQLELLVSSLFNGQQVASAAGGPL